MLCSCGASRCCGTMPTVGDGGLVFGFLFASFASFGRILDVKFTPEVRTDLTHSYETGRKISLTSLSVHPPFLLSIISS